MTIHNQDAFIDALWDYSFLNDCFPGTRISVSDVDGYIERFGHFLFLEFKGPDKAIPAGQMRSIQAMAARGDTVIAVYGLPQRPQKMRIWYPGKGAPRLIEPATLDDVRQHVGRWFRWANCSGGSSAP